jgi:hypothetical protein
MWRSAALAGSYVLAFWLLSAGPAGPTCGQECDGDYASAIDDCKSLHGDDPADADELATCIGALLVGFDRTVYGAAGADLKERTEAALRVNLRQSELVGYGS